MQRAARQPAAQRAIDRCHAQRQNAGAAVETGRTLQPLQALAELGDQSITL
jgi:hypothetical protein